MGTVGNDFPQLGTIFDRGKPFPHGGKLFSTVGFPACLASTHPSIGTSIKEGQTKAAPPLWRRPEAAPPMDGCLEARQAGRGKWFPTVGNPFPPWEIISYDLPHYLQATASAADL